MVRLETLYEKKEKDKLIPLKDENGFTLVSEYPEGREGRSIFLRVYIDYDSSNSIAGGADMVSTKESEFGGGHSILDNDDPKGRITPFHFNKDAGFTFDGEKINHKNFKRPLTMTEFVDFIIANHNRDGAAYLRFRQFSVKKKLELVFWLVDLRYSKLKLYRLEDTLIAQINEREKGQQKEPFLKYFDIPKNMFTFVMLVLSVLAILFISLKDQFQFLQKIVIPDVTNPFLVLFTATIFILMDKYAKHLNSLVGNVDDKMNGWVGQNMRMQYGFNQKVPIDFSYAPKK